MKVLLLLVLTLGLGVVAFAQGGSVATLLDMGVGARALGMGGAVLSLRTDASSLLYNPAGLAFLEERQLSGYAARPFGALNHLAVGFAQPFWGVSVMQLDVAGAAETNAFGNPTGRPLNYVSRAGVAGWGYEVVPGLALGAQLKVYTEQNGPLQGLGWALEPALLYTDGSLSLGAVWRGALNEAVRYDNGHSERWPNALSAGASWLWAIRPEVSLRLAADADGLLSDNGVALHVGAELWLNNLGLRAGWDRGLMTFGASVVYRNLSLHLAYALHETLPETVRLSATVSF